MMPLCESATLAGAVRVLVADAVLKSARNAVQSVADPPEVHEASRKLGSPGRCCAFEDGDAALCVPIVASLGLYVATARPKTHARAIVPVPPVLACGVRLTSGFAVAAEALALLPVVIGVVVSAPSNSIRPSVEPSVPPVEKVALTVVAVETAHHQAPPRAVPPVPAVAESICVHVPTPELLLIEGAVPLLSPQ